MYKRTNLKAIIFSFLLLFTSLLFGQTTDSNRKIGLVLSGGGATGFAHIGVLKALEENGIPIDYISGTSAGALIGALYACGYSPDEIEAFAMQPDFLLMSEGKLRADQKFYTKENVQNGSMFSFNFSVDSLVQKSLPTSFTNSTYLDFELMRLLGVAGAYTGNDFDSLFIPFRCLASDIVKKETVVFREGYLNEAVRASMTFPFYFQPLSVDGRILFDGGLYNNFPADVMYEDFFPDFIIGSNVSYNADKPQNDDLISQLVNMLVRYSDFSLPCENGLIIEPQVDMSTFDFDNVEIAIQLGYEEGLKYIDSILPNISSRVDTAAFKLRRKAFKDKIGALSIDQITVDGPQKSAQFVKKSLTYKKENEHLNADDLEKRYYRLAATDQLNFLFPVLEKNDKGTFGHEIDYSRIK